MDKSVEFLAQVFDAFSHSQANVFAGKTCAVEHFPGERNDVITMQYSVWIWSCTPHETISFQQWNNQSVAITVDVIIMQTIIFGPFFPCCFKPSDLKISSVLVKFIESAQRSVCSGVFRIE